MEKFPASVEMAEQAIKEILKKWVPWLDQHLNVCEWREQVVGICTLIVRCLMNKKMAAHAAKEFPLCPVPSGKLTKDKLNKLKGYWTNYVDHLHPDMQFGTATGWNLYHAKAPDQMDETCVVLVPAVPVGTVPVPVGTEAFCEAVALPIPGASGEGKHPIDGVLCVATILERVAPNAHQKQQRDGLCDRCP